MSITTKKVITFTTSSAAGLIVFLSGHFWANTIDQVRLASLLAVLTMFTVAFTWALIFTAPQVARDRAKRRHPSWPGACRDCGLPLNSNGLCTPQTRRLANMG